MQVAGLKAKSLAGVENIDARAICSIPVGETPDGSLIEARVGRYGPYLQVGDTDRRANLPNEIVPDELDAEVAIELIRQSDLANRPLGNDPESGKPIYLKTGRYGPYVQLGDPELTPKGNIKKGSKPKMASLFPDMKLETITLEEAVFLLSFPKVLGLHPEHKVEITAQDGQYGPYLTMEVDEKRQSRSLEDHDHLRRVTLADAIKLYAEPAKRRGRGTPKGPLKTLEESPITKKVIEIRTGKFGPYVTDGVVNATIPAVRDPMNISMDDALELIAAREDRMRAQGKEPRPEKKAKKKAAKKVTKKKAKKKATKKKAKKKTTKKKTTKK